MTSEQKDKTNHRWSVKTDNYIQQQERGNNLKYDGEAGKKEKLGRISSLKKTRVTNKKSDKNNVDISIFCELILPVSKQLTVFAKENIRNACGLQIRSEISSIWFKVRLLKKEVGQILAQKLVQFELCVYSLRWRPLYFDSQTCTDKLSTHCIVWQLSQGWSKLLALLQCVLY